MSEGVIDLTLPPVTYVYRAYDKGGDLLYVGVTDVLHSRMRQHAAGSPWWALAATIEWETYDSREYALALESELIQGLEPPHNTAGKGGTVYRPPSEATLLARARRISPADRLGV